MEYSKQNPQEQDREYLSQYDYFLRYESHLLSPTTDVLNAYERKGQQPLTYSELSSCFTERYNVGELVKQLTWNRWVDETYDSKYEPSRMAKRLRELGKV